MRLSEHSPINTVAHGWHAQGAYQLVTAFILSRLDYCNSVLAGLPQCTTEPLQHVLNAAARLVLNLRLHEHITPALQQLRWLLIDYRITYKLTTTKLAPTSDRMQIAV